MLSGWSATKHASCTKTHLRLLPNCWIVYYVRCRVGVAGIPGDNPILHVRDDVLGRGPIAESFARQVLALDVSLGAVVGVLGKWGSGKTSFVNMARDDFRSAGSPVLDFNPWMFSGAECRFPPRCLSP